MYRRVLPLLLTAVLLLSGCAAGQKNMPQKTDEKEMTGQSSDMSGEGIMYMDTTENVIYLAGGCFWGMEQLMQSIPGVIDAESGYANGTCEADADYQTVCKGNTGFRETVRVEYDPGQVSLDALLLAYFYVIDPTVENRQGNDRGQPVSDRRLLHQRKREGNGGAHRGDRAGTQRKVLRGDRPAQELLSRRGVPPGLSGEESERLLPYPAKRRWSCSPDCASIRATTKSPRRNPSGTS